MQIQTHNKDALRAETHSNIQTYSKTLKYRDIFKYRNRFKQSDTH